MSKMNSALIVTVLVLAFFLLAAKTSADNERERHHNATLSSAAQSDSFRKGPRYVSTHQLADNEEISILLVPSRDSLDDTRCIVYKNSAIGAVQMKCQWGLFSQDIGDYYDPGMTE